MQWRLASLVAAPARNDFYTAMGGAARALGGGPAAPPGAALTDPEENPMDPLNTQNWPDSDEGLLPSRLPILILYGDSLLEEQSEATHDSAPSYVQARGLARGLLGPGGRADRRRLRRAGGASQAVRPTGGRHCSGTAALTGGALRAPGRPN